MKIIAHRGAPRLAPENTIPSFQKALDMAVEGIELDVQLSSDGVPVVIHDFVLDRTSDKKGFIHKTSWNEIRRADGGSWFSPDFSGVHIPSLEEVLALVPPEVLLNIEIKSLSFLEENTAQIIVDLLAQSGKRNLIISSFNHRILKNVQDLSPGLPLGILSASEMIDFPSYIERSGLKPHSLHPEASYLSPSYIEDAHKKGWKVYCYTLNTVEQASMAESIGVDGFFTDYPELWLN